MMTILVTGATDGIGLETVKRFAQEGYNLLLHGRNAEKLESVKKQLLEINPSVSVQTFVADLSELKNTKLLAEKILGSVEEIDVIINNAAVSEEFADKTGAYYDNDYEKFGKLHPFALNKENRVELVVAMDEIIGEKC